MKNRVVRLRDVASLNISNRRQNEKKIAYLDTGNIIENRVIKIQYFDYLDNIPSRAKRKVKEEDTIFSMVRPNQKHFGYINRSMENLIVSTGFSVVTPNKNKINSRYLFYLLTNNEVINIFQKLAEGCVSTYPTLSLRDLLDFEFKLPSLEEQKRIADILTALDDKIELNNQMNQTLEEIASLLYKRWFVDFEFPDDKGNPYKSSGGEMVDSELGMIPKGWEVKELGDICETIASGSTPSKIDVDNALDTSNELIGFIKVKDIINSEIQFSKIEFIPLLISEEKMRRSILKENDILLSMAGTIGRTARVSKEFSNMNINQALATIRVEDIIMIPYVYCWINSIATQDSFKSKTVHAVQANLSLSSIRKQKILIPETKVIKSYYNKINYNFKKIDLNILEINKLKKIKINYFKILF